MVPPSQTSVLLGLTTRLSRGKGLTIKVAVTAGPSHPFPDVSVIYTVVVPLAELLNPI